MRYRLRTLLILMAVGPPVLSVAWFGYLRVADAYRVAAMQPVRMQGIHAPMTSDLTDLNLSRDIEPHDTVPIPDE
jgi:hypothetical protein